MYATITLFTTKPGMRKAMEKLGDKMFNFLSGMKGFKNLTLIVDPEIDEYGGVTLWESKEDAESALEVTGAQLQEALSDIAKGPPTRRVYEVYEPKT